MSSTFQYEHFLSKIIELTKADKIKWDYLDSNKNLYDGLNTFQTGNSGLVNSLFFSSKNFDTDNSFYTKIDDNYIVVFTNQKLENESLIERLNLYLVPRTFKSIEVINDDDEIVRLQTIIKSKFPSAEDIVNRVMNISLK